MEWKNAESSHNVSQNAESSPTKCGEGKNRVPIHDLSFPVIMPGSENGTESFPIVGNVSFEFHEDEDDSSDLGRNDSIHIGSVNDSASSTFPNKLWLLRQLMGRFH